MSFEFPDKEAFQRRTTGAEPITCVGIPTVDVANNEGAVYYDIDPPGCWRRVLVFLRGLIYGFTALFCCPAVTLTSDDLTWGLRTSVIGRMLGNAIGGGALGIVSVYLGCWVGSEIAVCVGDEDDRTGCKAGSWSVLAFAVCFIIFAGIRGIPTAAFRSTGSAITDNDDPQTEPLERN